MSELQKLNDKIDASLTAIRIELLILEGMKNKINKLIAEEKEINTIELKDLFN